MAYRSRSPVNIGILLLTVLVCIYLHHTQSPKLPSSVLQLSVDGHEPSSEILQSLSLTEEQCAATFPGLTKEIDDAVARGPFSLKRQPDHYTGLVQGRIKDGKVLFGIHNFCGPGPVSGYAPGAEFRSASTVSCGYYLSVSSPRHDLCSQLLDTPMNNSWAFSRSNSPHIENRNYWVMPHFSFWSWPISFIGTIDAALFKIERIEKNTQWTEKIDKAIWRGTGSFNSAGNNDSRPSLILKSQEKE
ncbi:hypothetical protein DSL72_002020 [Monilinia vaccinii-corymbosi]|uniref:Glycosyl transferase CAP10 domain-containing protein n=1 Tax=Monilinia vaccinii-corymbosi TaxID=61207 RepID=A0A8A3PBF6_9HELO|nr:hypothetical protein DSL72_002020 [Monilinia vaccinii-corymbosi]